MLLKEKSQSARNRTHELLMARKMSSFLIDQPSMSGSCRQTLCLNQNHRETVVFISRQPWLVYTQHPCTASIRCVWWASQRFISPFVWLHSGGCWLLSGPMIDIHKLLSFHSRQRAHAVEGIASSFSNTICLGFAM